MSSSHDPNSTSPINKKRPRPAADDISQVSSTGSLGMNSMSLERQPPRIPDPIRKLRLEAIFHPKFENEKSTKDIRQEMTKLIKDQKGYLEVSLKHSGSLVLWSGDQRYYSKNSLSNQFTAVAEILLRQHFERAWRTSSEDGTLKYEECSRFLENSRLTCAFEVVTSVLGDHGDIPNRDFLILTAVADRSTERFFSTAKVLELAQRFRLPHNDAWAFTTCFSCEALFRLYDESRETGLATDTISALSNAAEVHVASMYPHVDFQGDILEGFIIRYITYPTQSDSAKHQVEEQLHRLARNADQILHHQVPPSLPACFEIAKADDLALYKTDIRNAFQTVEQGTTTTKHGDIFAKKLEDVLEETDGGGRRRIQRISTGSHRVDLPDLTRELLMCTEDRETRRIAVLLQTMSELNKAVAYTAVEEQLPARPARTLCVINVLHDQSFLKYQNTKEAGAMNLFRGFCVELCNKDRASFNDGATAMECDDSKEGSGPVLMLKMKLLPYMVRTFICRNLLNVLKQDGTNAFVRAAGQLFNRWSISNKRKEKWMPFVEQWAIYAKERLRQPMDGLPTLTSSSYLRHFKTFTQLYDSGKLEQTMETDSSSPFLGLACVISPTVKNSKRAADGLAHAVGCSKILPLSEASDSWSFKGTFCYGTVGDLSRKNREFLNSVAQYLVIIMYGCSQEEIEIELFGQNSKSIKACQGKCRGWEKQSCFARLILSKTAIPENSPPCSGEFDLAIAKVKEAAKISAGSEQGTDTRPGVLVFFPGIPGCGKSSLLDTTGEKLQRLLNNTSTDGETRNVHVLAGDELGKNFWQRLKVDLTKDLSSVMIADKNTPPASWNAVGSTCSSTGTFPLAVFPDKASLKTTRVMGSRNPDGTFDPDRSHFYPFSLEYLAICMARVLKREAASHIGKLDSGTRLAGMIVIMFYSFYRYKSAEEFRDVIAAKMKSCGTLDTLAPVELPFTARSNVELGEGAKMVLTEALQLQIGYDKAKVKVKMEDPVIQHMEMRLRECMKNAQDEVLSIGAELSTSQQAFTDQVAQRVLSLNATQNADSYRNEFGKPIIKLASIDVPCSLVHRIIKDMASSNEVGRFLDTAQEAEEVAWEEDHYRGEYFLEQTHITMLFWKDTTQETLRNIFGPLLGTEVELRATALLWGNGVAALEVSIAETSGDGKKVPACSNDFAHITVWKDKDAQAWMSNRLPILVKEGAARRVEFAMPIPLIGTVSFWDFENKPLPVQS